METLESLWWRYLYGALSVLSTEIVSLITAQFEYGVVARANMANTTTTWQSFKPKNSLVV